jgi:hypothetical protein
MKTIYIINTIIIFIWLIIPFLINFFRFKNGLSPTFAIWPVKNFVKDSIEDEEIPIFVFACFFLFLVGPFFITGFLTCKIVYFLWRKVFRKICLLLFLSKKEKTGFKRKAGTKWLTPQ